MLIFYVFLILPFFSFANEGGDQKGLLRRVSKCTNLVDAKDKTPVRKKPFFGGQAHKKDAVTISIENNELIKSPVVAIPCKPKLQGRLTQTFSLGSSREKKSSGFKTYGDNNKFYYLKNAFIDVIKNECSDFSFLEWVILDHKINLNEQDIKRNSIILLWKYACDSKVYFKTILKFLMSKGADIDIALSLIHQYEPGFSDVSIVDIETLKSFLCKMKEYQELCDAFEDKLESIY